MVDNNAGRHYEKEKDAYVLALPCEKLVDNPLRLEFYSQAHIIELTVSIKLTGLLEPVLVQPQGNGQYMILSGHYRVRAVRRLRQKEILCRVLKCDNRTALVIYCTSNILTRGLNAMEEAHIISGLMAKGEFTMEQVGELWGRSKSWVCRRIKLMTALDPKLKNELGKGNISPRISQELTRLPRGNEQERVLSIIRRNHFNFYGEANIYEAENDYLKRQEIQEQINRQVELHVPGITEVPLYGYLERKLASHRMEIENMSLNDELVYTRAKKAKVKAELIKPASTAYEKAKGGCTGKEFGVDHFIHLLSVLFRRRLDAHERLAVHAAWRKYGPFEEGLVRKTVGTLLGENHPVSDLTGYLDALRMAVLTSSKEK